MTGARAAIALAALTGVLLLGLALYAAPRVLPVSPPRTLVVEPAQWRPLAGQVALDAEGAWLVGADATGLSGLALADALPLRAADWRYLELPFERLPPTLQVGLRFAAEGEWRFVMLPRPDGRSTIDLGRLPGWTGTVASLQLLLLPADLLPSAAVRERSIAIVPAALHADGYAPAVAALLDEWTAPRPWTGRSINAAGRELAYAPARPWLPFLLAGGVLAWLALAWTLRWRGRRLRSSALACLIATWLLLDLFELEAMAERTVQARALRAAAGDAGLSVQPGLAVQLATLRAHIAQAHPDARVVLLADDAFLRAWVAFELMPLDVGAPEPARVALAPGQVVIRAGEIGRLLPEQGVFVLRGRRWVVEAVAAPSPWPAFAIVRERGH